MTSKFEHHALKELERIERHLALIVEALYERRTCSPCGGNGVVEGFPECPHCGGEGTIRVPRVL